MSFELTDNAKIAIQALRDADESIRVRGHAYHDGKVCACGVMSAALGYPLTKGTMTGEVVERIHELTAIPYPVLCQVPALNDSDKPAPAYSFEDIADWLAQQATEGEPIEPGSLTEAW